MRDETRRQVASALSFHGYQEDGTERESRTDWRMILATRSANLMEIAMTTTFLAILISIGLPLVVGWFVASRMRSEDRGRFAHFRCPTCRQRLRYRARKAGRQVLCPNCYHSATLPV